MHVEKMAADECEDGDFVDAILTQDLVAAGQEVLAVEELCGNVLLTSAEKSYN